MIEPISCPCCGQPVAQGAVPIMALREVPRSPTERRIVDALVDAFPRRVTKAYLIDALWGTDPDGGPETADKMINVYMLHLRRHLPEFGWTIPKNHGGVGHHGLYRLEPLA